MSATLAAAVAAAKAAGKVHRTRYGRVRDIRFKSGNQLNLVTEVDGRCERLIRGLLTRRFPTHAFWGEEGGGALDAKRPTWIVDPLDGTTNYAHGYPFFCVSIALVREGRLAAGVIYDSLRDECFTAERGKGAFLNGRRLRVSRVGAIGQSLLCTGFAYGVLQTRYNFDNFRNFVMKSQGVRRDGSAAMNLAYVAAGRFEGFWERGIQAWDMAAGVLLVREAGGRVTD
ncbi:MAG TPA: inositol monophosphatase family protein, partial [bacterium]|nr:inositol monophosphatase family protein [bacterium]